MTVMASPIPSGRQDGFTYLSVVILVTILGLVGATSLRLGSTLQRVALEEQLLDIGTEYSDALASYAADTPPGQPTFPPSFKELLKDPRFPQVKRHLRRIYPDPVTGKMEWGLIKANEKGGILAIYSLSTAQPIKVGNFPPQFVAFDGKAHLSDWKFSAEHGAGGASGTKPGAPPPGQPPGGGKDGAPVPMPQEPPPMVPPIQQPSMPPPAEPEPEPEPEAAPPPEPEAKGNDGKA